MAVSNMRQRFVALLEALPAEFGGEWTRAASALAEVAKTERVAAELDFGGQKFVLVHSSDPEVDETLVVECRFGSVPKMLQAECHARLLDLNYRSSRRTQCGFSIDPATCEVVYATACSLARLSVEDLQAVLDATATAAAVWRKNYFLDDPRAIMPAFGLSAPNIPA